MIRITAAVFLLVAAPVHATTISPTPAEIAEAKASLREAADGAFMEGWTRMAEEAARDGVTASELRSATQWTILGFSLGTCHGMVPAGLLAEWTTAFDRIPFGSGEASEQVRVVYRQKGRELLSEGEYRDLYGPAGPRRTARCKIELAAVREILREPL